MNIDIIRILTISDYDLIELLLLTYIVLSIMYSIMIYFFNVQVFPKNMLLLKSKSFVVPCPYFPLSLHTLLSHISPPPPTTSPLS